MLQPAVLQLGASFVLLAAGALGLRAEAGAWRARPPVWVLAIDVLPLLLGVAVFGTLSARPLLGALITVALAIGLGVADRVKRSVLHEPVVFADRAELLEVVRHPEFYIPFAGTAVMAAGTAALLAIIAIIAWQVPPLWDWSPWPPALALLACAACLLLPGRPVVLAWLHRRYDALSPTRDPAQDAARWGLCASLIIHATLARAERPGLRHALPPLPAPATIRPGAVVMVQLESFFDPRRIHPAVPEGVLPGYDSCLAEAVAWGPLKVPCWGANTVRTEFSALAGVDVQALGLDRFNPYERFALHPIETLARRMQALGRQTVCLHPFDLSFYNRRRVLPALGFDRLIGPEAFPATRGFVDDATLAQYAAGLIAAEGPGLFLFVISVGNHGPWLHDRGPEDACPLPEALAQLPDAEQFRRFLGGVRRTDAVFPILSSALQAQGAGTLLCFGDHQPSLPGLLPQLLPGDTDTDYLLWDTHPGPGGPSHPRSVDTLPSLLLNHLATPRP